MKEKARILVVEDEGIVAENLATTISDMGYEVVGRAVSAEEAVKKALELEPDLILMDIVLKGNKNGIDASQEIKKKKDIPIIFLTAYSDISFIDKAKSIEPYAYIVKPFQPRQLLASIEMALYKSRMEKKLQETQEWFSITLKSIGDCVIATDSKGYVKFMNTVAEAVTGWNMDDAVGKLVNVVYNIINEETGEPAEDPVTRVIREGTVAGLPNHTLLITKDGTKIHIDDSGAPIRDDRGNIIGVVLVFQDITERKRAEDEIKLNETRLRLQLELHKLMDAPQQQILDFVNEAILKTVQSKFAFIGLMDDSESVMTIHAWSKDTMVQCAIDDKPMHFPISGSGIWGNCVRERKPIIINNYDVSHPNKKSYPAGHVPIKRFLGVPIFDGDKIVAVGAVANKETDYIDSDVTAITVLLNKTWEIFRRKRAEQILQKLNMAISNSQEVVFMTDKEGIITYINPEFTKMYGYTAGEVIGKTTPRILKSGLISAEGYEQFWKVLLNEQNIMEEYTNKCKDGRLIDIEGSADPILNDKDEIIGFLGIQRDITDRKHAEEKINNYLTKLKNLAAHLQTVREDERTAIARDIHDDMGQDLTALKIELSLIENEVKKKSVTINQSFLLNEIKDMKAIVNNTINKVRKLIRELRPEVLDNLGLQDALKWQAKEFEKRNRIKCSYTSNISEIDLDKKRSTAIFRILQETLTNIIKHAKASRVEISFNKKNGTLLLEINDNGKGFSLKDVDDTKSMGIIGMRERVAVFGGELEISSQVKKGTKVIVSIPIK
ncbi:MAG: PAS domain S-box protein [Bacteroidetes bacterium]|nr:PAS domain S-box protein [Bacteroidota bacterium]